MTKMRIFLVMGLGLLSVSACTSRDILTRNAPFEQTPASDLQVPAGYTSTQPTSGTATPTASQAPVSVNSITVTVPRALKVSEANRYLPSGDIVWREDPFGDRHAQVEKIFVDALAAGVAPLNGPVKVDLDIQVLRFHALTEKARYTTGGVHSIRFEMAIKDPATGELLAPVRTIKADLDGFGGQQALVAEAKGLTQKVRISSHLSEVIRQELTNPKGYENAKLGLFQMLNNI